MSLLNRFGRAYSAPVLTLRMIVVPEGIKVGLYRDGRVAASADVGAVRRLPQPLIDLLQRKNRTQDHIYMLPWPEAKALYDAIKVNPTDSLILEAQDIEGLERVEKPANFRVHWAYNAAQKRLERQLVGADLHLGMGWYRDGRRIWPIHRNVPDWAGQWLSNGVITSAYLYRFLVEFFLPAQNARWPVSCELSLDQNLALRLELIRMLDRSMDVQLVGSDPQVLQSLDVLDGDAENMIGGTTLLAGIRSIFTPALVEIAHANLPVRLSGLELPRFIQDDLRPNAAKLGVDMRTVDDRYPMVPAESLPLGWRVTHEVSEGVGYYAATPYLADILLSTLANKAKAGERFMLAARGWLELTAVFKERLTEWKAQGIEHFHISPQELLGLQSLRMQSSGIQRPDIVLPEEASALEHIGRFLEILRRHGVPGGFSGLQNEGIGLLIGACQRLLRDNPQAKILWVVPQRRRPVVAEGLQQAKVAFSNAEEHQNTLLPTGQVEGRIILTSPGTQVELAKAWTLIIFQDLDLLAFSDALVYFYYQLERKWSLGTFSRPNWTDDRRRAQQALHALQLAPENLDTFRSKYVRDFPEEKRTLLMRLASPLRRAITGEIPPRPLLPPELDEPPTVRGDTPVHTRVQPATSLPGQPDQPAPIVPTAPTQTPAPAARAWATPAKEVFLTQARRLADRTESAAEPVPFNQHWPTYDMLNAAQQRWYFYWRSEARQGRMLPTDTGYLFLNAYELVNQVGFETPQAAFDYFVRLWRHYRPAVARLDRYFVDWLADFTVVYGLAIKPLDWYAQAIEDGANGGSFDVSIEAWVQHGAILAVLPTEYLYQLAGYSPARNKFYQAHNTQGNLDAAYVKAVSTVDAAVRQVEGKSIFELYRPAASRSVRRDPFAGAFYHQRGGPITIAQASPWAMSNGNALAQRLTSIIKYTENILRRQAKFKSQLQGIDLPREWAVLLDAAFAIPAEVAPRRQISINMASVDALKRETDELRKRLIIEETGTSQAVVTVTSQPNPPAVVEKASEMPAPVSASSPAPVPATPPALETASEVSTDTATAEFGTTTALTDLAAVSAIVGDPSGIRGRLLRILRNNDWQADQAALNGALLPGQFLNVELDYINESALEKLGDALIFQQDSHYTVAEDFRDEVIYLLDHAAPPADVLPSPAIAPATQTADTSTTSDLSDFSALDPGWARFAQKMKPQHWEALAALLNKTDATARLEAIARGSMTTTSRLVDDINGFALDSIGDIVLATDQEPAYVEDEDTAALQTLLNWAHSQALWEA